jgi:hypothetical protein
MVAQVLRPAAKNEMLRDLCAIFHSSGKQLCSPRLSLSADDGPRPRCLVSSEPDHLKHASANNVMPRR